MTNVGGGPWNSLWQERVSRIFCLNIFSRQRGIVHQPKWLWSFQLPFQLCQPLCQNLPLPWGLEDSLCSDKRKLGYWVYLSGFSQASAVNGDSLFFPKCNENPSNMYSLAWDRACASINWEDTVCWNELLVRTQRAAIPWVLPEGLKLLMTSEHRGREASLCPKGTIKVLSFFLPHNICRVRARLAAFWGYWAIASAKLIPEIQRGEKWALQDCSEEAYHSWLKRMLWWILWGSKERGPFSQEACWGNNRYSLTCLLKGQIHITPGFHIGAESRQKEDRTELNCCGQERLRSLTGGQSSLLSPHPVLSLSSKYNLNRYF